MKAFVTGGSGFLGYHLIKQLMAQDWEVVALFRHGSANADLRSLGCEMAEGSLTDIESLRDAMPENLDCIFHLAGDTNMWSVNNERQYQTNVTGTENMVKVALEKRAKRFVHTSSIAAYGFHQGVITETSKSHALSSNVNYLRTKYLGEKAVKEAVEFHGLDAVILNPCGIIGSHDRNNWSQLFTLVNNDNLPGVPAGEGSYCHVEAVAAAHIAAYEKGQTGENYILGGTNCSFLEVVQKVGSLLNKPTPSKTVSPTLLSIVGNIQHLISLITRKEPSMTPEKAQMVSKRVISKSDKAIETLNYQAGISMDKMLQDCFDWMKAEKMI